MFKFHYYSGIVLYELMISLSIMTVILVLAIPTLQSFSQERRSILFANQLLHALAFAEQMTRIYKRPIGFCPSLNHLTCSSTWTQDFLIFFDDDQHGNIRTAKQIILLIQNKDLKGHLYFRSYPFYRHYLAFYPHDWIIGDNGSFWYCSSKKANPVWAIVLSQAGKATLKWPSKEGSIKNHKGQTFTC